MAPHDDEMNKRRQRREEMRQKQQAEQKRLKTGLIIAGILLVVCTVALLSIIRDTGTLDSPETETSAAVKETQPPETKPQTWSEQNSTTTINIRAAGDLNITDSVVKSGLTSTGYDFTRSIMDVAPLLSEADLTVLNLEGNIVGEPYGTERTSAPNDLLTALRNAGVDLIQMANSCAINNGLIGLKSTINAIHNSGMEPIGAYATQADFNRSKGYTICEANGIKVAFVAFTKGMNGMTLPEGSEHCVNLLYTDYDSTYQKINRDLINDILDEVEKEKPDLTVAMLHWGSEYNDNVSDSQESLVSLLQERGVNAIIGSHPHFIHQMTYDPETGNFVAYSLGDLLSDGTRSGTEYSVVLNLEITKTAESTKITGYSYTPIFSVSERGRSLRSVRIAEAMIARDGNHIERVNASTYDAMTYALGRIESRIKGE